MGAPSDIGAAGAATDDNDDQPSSPPSEPGRSALGSAYDPDERTEDDEEQLFYLSLMRGWKLLLNAGLEGRERTQILTTTNNSYEYSIVA